MKKILSLFLILMATACADQPYSVSYIPSESPEIILIEDINDYAECESPKKEKRDKRGR